MTLPATQPENAANGTGELTTVAKGQARLLSRDDSKFSAILDLPKFEQLQNVAKLFAASTLVPEQFRGNMPNCFVAMQMALRLGVDPLMFMQASYVVHGKPGIEAKLAIALANSSGVFKGPIQYAMAGSGRERKCTAYGTLTETGERVEMTVDWTMVEAEGWNADKKGMKSKWTTMPEMMFRYRAAMFLIRTHCPEVTMGLLSKEELQDMTETQPVRVTPQQRPAIGLDALADRLLGAPVVDESDVSAAEQAAAGEAGEVPTDASDPPFETPDADVLKAFENAIAEAKSAQRVNYIASEFMKDLPEHLHGTASELCDRRIAELGKAKTKRELVQ